MIKRIVSMSSKVALAAAMVAVIVGCAIPASAAATDAKSFFNKMVGEWVGTCRQTTDGKSADNKYFHVLVKQISPNTYTSNFDYYRVDSKTKKLLKIGSSDVTTTIGADGVARNKISGKGTMLVDFKPKQQTHQLQEVLSSSSDGLKGQGSGTLSVSGMPLGLGKGGKIQSATSTWSLNNDTLTIHQTIKAGFRALFISKTYDVVATYVAKRGTDIASIVSKQAQVSAL